MQWAQAPQQRQRIALFPKRLDDVLPADNTPLATVDVQSGLIVSANVIAMTNEDEPWSRPSRRHPRY